MSHLRRSISEPIRQGLNFAQRWHDEDRGLIYCWERGREMRLQKPALAKRAERGELVLLAWRGGIDKKIKGNKNGTLFYLAAWQGLRGEDLSINTGTVQTVVCTKTGQAVNFSWEG